MVRVVLPVHLRRLSQSGDEVELEIAGTVTLGAVLTALETRHPTLRGTFRDSITQQRRPFVRFFACKKDWSHEAIDCELPSAIANGSEVFYVVGAMAGG